MRKRLNYRNTALGEVQSKKHPTKHFSSNSHSAGTTSPVYETETTKRLQRSSKSDNKSVVGGQLKGET